MSTASVNGWEIVCPDGRRRHYPYTNQDDAIFDAELYEDAERCVDAFGRHLECPGGLHTTRPVAFNLPEQPS